MKNLNNITKLLTFILALLIILPSCQKDEAVEEQQAEDTPHRGRLISQEMKLIYSKDLLNTMLESSGEQLLESSFDVLYDVALYKLTYETIDLEGNFTIATGLLAVPQNLQNAPILSFQHGATLDRELVASKLVGTWYLIGTLFCTNGYITALPDYLGLGDSPGLHPFLHAKSEASATIDMIRATQEFCEEKDIPYNDDLFLAGYSQGGHATLATLKYIEQDFPDEFNIKACAPMAGPYDLSGVQAENFVSKEPYEFQAYFPYMLFAMNSVYHVFDDISTQLVSPYNTLLPNFFDGTSLTSLDELEPDMPSSGIPSDILTETAYNELINRNHPIYDALADNNLTTGWKPNAPLKLYHCDQDFTAFYQNAEIAFSNFTNAGATDIELINPLNGGTHATCAVPSITQAFFWFESLKNKH